MVFPAEQSFGPGEGTRRADTLRGGVLRTLHYLLFKIVPGAPHELTSISSFARRSRGPHRRYRRHLLRSYAPWYSTILEAYSVQACTRSRRIYTPLPLFGHSSDKGVRPVDDLLREGGPHIVLTAVSSDATREEATVSVTGLADMQIRGDAVVVHRRDYGRSSNLRDAKNCFQRVHRVGFAPSRRRPLLRCSTRGVWHGCSDPTPKRQRPPPDARG